MLQRIFRSDDTSLWLDKMGGGSDGVYTPGSSTTDSPIVATATGTNNTTSLSATNASFAAGQLIMIIQLYGTGAGNAEFNKISSYSAGTITTAYPLGNDYVTGAMVIVAKQYSSVTINGGIQVNVQGFDGAKNGALLWFVSGTCQIDGIVYGNGAGFRGSNTVGVSGFSGEGTGGSQSDTRSANGNGGGGGQERTDGAPGGGGGGNNGAGSTAGAIGGQPGGNGGGSVGNMTGTLFTMGGGGGKGGGGGSGSFAGGPGGNGGPIIIIVAKKITGSGRIQVPGAAGGNFLGTHGGGGGAGAGGYALLKAQVMDLANLTIDASNAAGGAADSGTSGGNSAYGYIHADYSQVYNAPLSAIPSIDVRQDVSLETDMPATMF